MNKLLLPVFIFFFISSFAQKKELSLRECVLKHRTLSPDRINKFLWIPNSRNYSFLSADWKTLLKSTISSEKVTELAKIDDINLGLKTFFLDFYGMSWLSENDILLNDGQTIAKWNIASNSGEVLKKAPEKSENHTYHLGSNKLAYTIENNLFVDEIAVTKNLDKNIVSGQSIARNEFGISEGIFWSNNGNYLAFYQKNETNVHNYPLLDINATPGELISIKYPMAGQKSEEPRIGIFNLKTKKTIYINPRGAKDDYLTNLTFTPDEKCIIVAEVNRDQNHMWLNVYDSKSGKFIKTLFEETNDKWVEPVHPAYFYSDSNDFIWISERDGFNNLYLYDFNGRLKKKLTEHQFVVKEILNTSPNKKLIYYSATGANPTNTLVYSVDFDGNSQLITKEEGTHTFSLSSDGIYFFDAFSSLTVPYKSMIYTNSGKITKLLMESKDKLEDYNLGTTEIGILKAKDGSDLYYRLIKPSDFDSTKKYPVLVYVYGGPQAQMVTNTWLAGADLWMNWMANQGYLIFTLDNRGSAERGFAFESQIHRRLGDIEMEDQMTGVDYLKSHSFVDGNRLAVHGWSYGGFMTTTLMLRQPGTFKVGVAGGLVTDWKYYEVMYGERYMDRPEQNSKGYEKASLLNYAQNLKGDLLLIHGTIDDVVVMQHNYALVQKFIEFGKQMDFFPYPMHKHNVKGKDRFHLLEKTLTYILEKNN
jgi:dipeptidyl-peptidase-4